jgi:hypothetical protein
LRRRQDVDGVRRCNLRTQQEHGRRNNSTEQTHGNFPPLEYSAIPSDYRGGLGALSTKPLKLPHLYLRHRSEKAVLGERFFCMKVLLACNLPLHERIIRQLAIPEPPQVQAILIQGAGFVGPSYAAEQHGKPVRSEAEEGCR